VTGNGDDRRKNPRFPVDVPVRLTGEGGVQSARLKDICRDAALVEGDQVWPLDAEVAIAMELPGTGGPLEVTGQVIRIVPGERKGMAILFTRVSPAAGMRIDFFVALQTDLSPDRV
jgi:PilZ domain